MPEIVDMSGNRYGRLTVVRYSHVRETPNGSRKHYWLCQCDCGQEKIAPAAELRAGRVASCGCLRREMVATKNHKHGGSNSSEYRIWSGIKKRCFNPAVGNFADYGGRGITICERWLDSFENFLADVGPRPSPSHSIDRVDVNGNYEPGNVRWATPREQMSNLRTNIRVTIDGDTRAVSEWARLYKINPYTIYDRLDAGWDPKRAVTEKPRKRATS